MKKSSFIIAFVLFALCAQLCAAQSNRPSRLNAELATLLSNAANTPDPKELDGMLAEDYTQSDVSSSGNSLTTKSRILRQLADIPEALRPLNERVTTRAAISNLKAVKSGEVAVFTADLVARSVVRVSGKVSSKNIAQIERFEVSGSAVKVDGRWRLASLRRSRTTARDASVRLAELNGNKAFETAIFGLLLEGAARARAAKPEDFY